MVSFTTNYLATKRNYYARLRAVGVQGMFEESLVSSMILQPILCTSTEEACEDRLAAL